LFAPQFQNLLFSLAAWQLLSHSALQPSSPAAWQPSVLTACQLLSSSDCQPGCKKKSKKQYTFSAWQLGSILAIQLFSLASFSVPLFASLTAKKKKKYFPAWQLGSIFAFQLFSLAAIHFDSLGAFLFL